MAYVIEGGDDPSKQSDPVGSGRGLHEEARCPGSTERRRLAAEECDLVGGRPQCRPAVEAVLSEQPRQIVRFEHGLAHESQADAHKAHARGSGAVVGRLRRVGSIRLFPMPLHEAAGERSDDRTGGLGRERGLCRVPRAGLGERARRPSGDLPHG
ncbi:MAG: hypothetical protein ABSF84_06435 [Acidimicrobiales bacterium]